MTHDITGDGTCALCGRDWPVASLARSCEQNHLNQPPEEG